MSMTFGLIEVHRGADKAVLPKEQFDAIKAGKAPLLVKDNFRYDMSAPVLEPGTDRARFTHKLFYGVDENGSPVLDLEFSGAETEEKSGKHFQLGGQGIKNLQKSLGNTCNIHLFAGAPGGRNKVHVELHDSETGDVGSFDLISD